MSDDYVWGHYCRNPMLLKLKKACAWTKRIPKRITGFSTPFFGLSWSKDKSPESKSDNKVEQSSNPAETIKTKNRTVSCAFCLGNGRDCYYPQPCRICHGSGTLILDFDNPVHCQYCHGSGCNPYYPGPCNVCKGIGWVRRKS